MYYFYRSTAIVELKKGVMKVEYRNHCASEDATVGIHQRGEYLEKKYGVKFTAQEDVGWISRAKETGLAPEVTKYLKQCKCWSTKGC